MLVVATRTLMDGMVLAADASQDDGRPVCRAGTVVTRTVVQRLLDSRITRVAVTDTSKLVAARGSSARLASGAVAKPGGKGLGSETVLVQASLVRLAHMFREHREDPLMRGLCRMAIKFAQEKLIRV